MERVVVTGASRGIGAACVSAFQAKEVHVVGVDVELSSSADEHVVLDLARDDCGDRLAEALRGNPVDGLINNAALQLNQAAVDATAEDFDRVYAVNLRAPLLLSAALAPDLRERRGSIINIASVHAVATTKLVSIYAATKGGLASMTRALAVELGPEIRVNAVLPGAVATEMLNDGLSREGATIESLADKHVLNRVADPSEIASAVLFLAENGFTTGSCLVVDGGATIKLSTE